MSALHELRVELALSAFALDVAFSSEARTLGVVGRSGAGKTSLLETIVGWRSGARGRVEIAGRVLFDTDRGVRLPIEARGIGYVPQDLLLFEERSVRDNVLFGPRAARDELELVASVLQLRPLLDRRCATLSGGEKQRVALARALCSRPSVLVLDEPLGSVDAELRARILPFLLRVRDRFRLPTIVVSHDPTEVQALCDEIVLIDAGELVRKGPPADVLRERPIGPSLPDNVFAATVRELHGGLAAAEIAGGAIVHVPSRDLKVGERAMVALAADDLLLSTLQPRGISARNVVPATIDAVHRDARTCWTTVRCGASSDAVLVHVLLTESAIDELALAPGASVHLIFKASACRVIARDV